MISSPCQRRSPRLHPAWKAAAKRLRRALQPHRTLRLAWPLPVRIDRRGAGLRDQLALALQSRTPQYGLGRYHPKAAAGHGRIALLLAAPKNGGITGARLVREWDPATNAARTWYETLDQTGTIRSVAPKPVTEPLNHRIFDANGNYTGRR